MLPLGECLARVRPTNRRNTFPTTKPCTPLRFFSFHFSWWNLLHNSGPGASNTTQIPRKDPQEKKEKCGGRWEKERNFGRSGGGGPVERGVRGREGGGPWEEEGGSWRGGLGDHQNLDAPTKISTHLTQHNSQTTHNTTTTTTIQHNTKQHNTQNRSDTCQQVGVRSRWGAGGSGWGQSGSTLDWPNTRFGPNFALAKLGSGIFLLYLWPKSVWPKSAMTAAAASCCLLLPACCLSPTRPSACLLLAFVAACCCLLAYWWLACWLAACLPGLPACLPGWLACCLACPACLPACLPAACRRCRCRRCRRRRWTTSSLLPSATAPGRARPRSRTNTMVVTRPPPSRQMRAATLSRTHPLLQKERPAKGRGNRRRRRRITRKSWASSLVIRQMGQHERAIPAPDPPWDSTAFVPGTFRPSSTPLRAAIRHCSHAPNRQCRGFVAWHRLRALSKMWNEIPESIQLMGCVTGCSHDGSVKASLQLCNELTCHIWVPILNHWETVRPTCPERWHSQSISAARRPIPPRTQAKVNMNDAPKTLPNVHREIAHTTPRRQGVRNGAGNWRVQLHSGGATTTVIARLAPWESVPTSTVAPQSCSGGAEQRNRRDQTVFPTPLIPC